MKVLINANRVTTPEFARPAGKKSTTEQYARFPSPSNSSYLCVYYYIYELCEACRIVWGLRVDKFGLHPCSFVRFVLEMVLLFMAKAANHIGRLYYFCEEQGRPILARLHGGRCHRISPLHNGCRVIESSPVRVISGVRPSNGA